MTITVEAGHARDEFDLYNRDHYRRNCGSGFSRESNHEPRFAAEAAP